jgi:hypothetical protein
VPASASRPTSKRALEAAATLGVSLNETHLIWHPASFGHFRSTVKQRQRQTRPARPSRCDIAAASIAHPRWGLTGGNHLGGISHSPYQSSPSSIRANSRGPSSPM